jgi:hypothetical protein
MERQSGRDEKREKMRLKKGGGDATSGSCCWLAYQFSRVELPHSSNLLHSPFPLPRIGRGKNWENNGKSEGAVAEGSRRRMGKDVKRMKKEGRKEWMMMGEESSSGRLCLLTMTATTKSDGGGWMGGGGGI